MATILQNQYDVITLSAMIRFALNLVGQCRITCRWQWKSQNRNRK